jgi:hypothetical protein
MHIPFTCHLSLRCRPPSLHSVAAQTAQSVHAQRYGLQTKNVCSIPDGAKDFAAHNPDLFWDPVGTASGKWGPQGAKRPVRQAEHRHLLPRL